MKQAAVPVGGTHASAKAIGVAIANSLTRYQAKHPSTAQPNSLAINLIDFESALHYKLPEVAHQQRSWWTDESTHSQQWLAQGWQILDTQLTGPNPHVVFCSIRVQTRD